MAISQDMPVQKTGGSTRLQSLVFEGKLLDQVSEGLPDSFDSRYSGGKTDPECPK